MNAALTSGWRSTYRAQKPTARPRPKQAIQAAMDQGLVPQPWSQEKWEAILEEQRQATLEEQRRNEERSRKVKEESLRRYNAAGPP